MNRRAIWSLLTLILLLTLLSGCYSIQEGGALDAATSEKIPAEADAEKAMKMRGYDIPTENVLAGLRFVPSSTTGGFWTWTLFMQAYIQGFDPVTDTKYIPCYQAGCMHTDESCPAYFGDIAGLAEYRGNFYAMVYRNDETASAFVTRPASGGPMRVLASWEPETENEVKRCGLLCLSFGKAYIIVRQETYTVTAEGEETQSINACSLWSIDLETGEAVELIPDTSDRRLYGIWKDCLVYSEAEVLENAPSFDEWLLEQPEGTPWSDYTLQYVRYRLLYRDFKTGETRTLVDRSEDFVMTVDPNVCWGQYVVYQVDRSLYVYDMEAQKAKELFTHMQGDWDYYNYQLQDGHVIAICGTDEFCRSFAIDITEGTAVEMDNRGGNCVAFSIKYECDDYFVGLLSGKSTGVEDYCLRKEDFYRSDYDAAFRVDSGGAG